MKLDLFSPKGFRVDLNIFESFFEKNQIKNLCKSAKICVLKIKY